MPRLHVLLILTCSFCLQHDDLSPFEIKIQALEAQIEELTASIKSDQQLWLRQQAELVALTQELETNSKQMIKLQTENTGMQQKKIRLDGTTAHGVGSKGRLLTKCNISAILLPAALSTLAEERISQREPVTVSVS